MGRLEPQFQEIVHNAIDRRAFKDVTTPGADVEFEIEHGLGFIPLGFLVTNQDKPAGVYTSGTAWTTEKDFSEVQHCDDHDQGIDFLMLDACKELMASRFPFLNGDDIETILWICEKNQGLCYLPYDRPEYLICILSFWPVLIKPVEEQDFPVLLEADLTEGPLVYIAVLICPKDGYRLTWRLLQSMDPQPYAFCCHRCNTGKWRFQMKMNSRRQRGSHAGQH